MNDETRTPVIRQAMRARKKGEAPRPHFAWEQLDKHGKYQTRYRLIKDKPSVAKQEAQLELELEAGGGRVLPKEARAKRKRPTKKALSKYFEEWHAFLLTRAAPKQADAARDRTKRVLAAAGIQNIEQITVSRVATTINELRTVPRTPKKKADEYPLLSEWSRHHYQRAIKQFTSWLWGEGYLKEDPLDRSKWKLKKIKQLEERHPRDRLQPDELALLIPAVMESDEVIEGYNGEERAWLYTLAAMTGLRRGELASLHAKSFRWASKIVVVEAAYTKDSLRAEQPLNQEMILDLQAWVANRPGRLFPGLEDKRTHKMMQRDLAAAGLPYKTETGTRCFHSLRNTYISSLFDVGLSVRDVQRLARHSEVELTMKYAKPEGDDGALVNRLPYPGACTPQEGNQSRTQSRKRRSGQ